MTDDELRRQAVANVLSENPELKGAVDPESLARMSTLVDAAEKQLRLQMEIEEVQRQQFAEQARAQAQKVRTERTESARRQREEEERRRQLQREEEERVRREHTAAREAERKAALDSMNPFSRWVRMHAWITVGLSALALLIIGGGIGTFLVGEQRRAEASQAEADRKAAEERAAAEEQAMLASCDTELAGRNTTGSRYLAAWATCDAPETRQAVAGNSSTPSQALAGLVTDPESSVRAALASNTSADSEDLVALTGDPDPSVRLAFAKRPDLNDQTVLALLDPDDTEIRLALIEQATSETSAEVWAALAVGANSADEIRLALWGNESLPQAISSELTPPCVTGLGDSTRDLSGSSWRYVGTGSLDKGDVYEYELRPDCYVNWYSSVSADKYFNGSSNNSFWTQEGKRVTMSINNAYAVRNYELRRGRLILINDSSGRSSQRRLTEIPEISRG